MRADQSSFAWTMPKVNAGQSNELPDGGADSDEFDGLAGTHAPFWDTLYRTP
jgi:hypothetical protein